MNLSIFADRLSELIFDKKKKVREVAKDASVGKSTVYEYLSGQKTPTLHNLVKLADYFGCSTDYLLGLEEEQNELVFQPCKPFFERFEEVLQYFEITRYRLEKMTGIAESLLYYWAKGEKVPTIDNILLVCEKLDCRVDFFIGRSNVR